MIEAQGKEIRSLSMIVEKGFAAAKDDFDDLKHELKSDIIRVQEGVGSIEAQLRLGRYEKRLGKLEDEVFGKSRL
jgi:hypothetical protein